GLGRCGWKKRTGSQRRAGLRRIGRFRHSKRGACRRASDSGGDPKREAKAAVISGRVPPATRVFVGTVVAQVDKEGRFTARVPLKDEKNALTLLAADIDGRQKTLD